MTIYFLETTAVFWEKIGDDELQKALETENLNKNVAKNVILFLGDLMHFISIIMFKVLFDCPTGNRKCYTNFLLVNATADKADG